MIVIIDNYDSFTYNLVQYIQEAGQSVFVVRNNAASVIEIKEKNPSHIVISPGPGDPDSAGISKEVIKILGESIPILGVCLGHQCIGEVYGGIVRQANNLMHGKTSDIYHTGDGLFTGIANPFKATRYHSLIVQEPLPDVLTITAYTESGELMGIRHKEYPIFGVQFHPEAILTQFGKQLLMNFLALKV